jgi:hypothetical protein
MTTLRVDLQFAPGRNNDRADPINGRVVEHIGLGAFASKDQHVVASNQSCTSADDSVIPIGFAMTR